MEDFLEHIEKIAKQMHENKEDFEKHKEIVKEQVDKAKLGFILVTEKSSLIEGNGTVIKGMLGVLLKNMFERKIINKEDLDFIIGLAQLSNEELEARAKECLKDEE